MWEISHEISPKRLHAQLGSLKSPVEIWHVDLMGIIHVINESCLYTEVPQIAINYECKAGQCYAVLYMHPYTA